MAIIANYASCPKKGSKSVDHTLSTDQLRCHSVCMNFLHSSIVFVLTAIVHLVVQAMDYEHYSVAVSLIQF